MITPHEEARQFWNSSPLEMLGVPLKHHFSVKVPRRIPEFAVAVLKTCFPGLMSHLAKGLTQNIEIVPISKEDPTWKEVIALTNNLKEKVEIKTPFTFCHLKKQKDQLGVFQNSFILSERLLSYPQDEKEFLITHELMHHKRSHLRNRFALSFFFAALDLTALYYRRLFTFLSIEIGAFYMENRVSRHQEKEADLEAIKALGTNEGAIATFERKIAQETHSSWEVSHPSTPNRLQYSRSTP